MGLSPDGIRLLLATVYSACEVSKCKYVYDTGWNKGTGTSSFFRRRLRSLMQVRSAGTPWVAFTQTRAYRKRQGTNEVVAHKNRITRALHLGTLQPWSQCCRIDCFYPRPSTTADKQLAPSPIVRLPSGYHRHRSGSDLGTVLPTHRPDNRRQPPAADTPGRFPQRFHPADSGGAIHGTA